MRPGVRVDVRHDALSIAIEAQGLGANPRAPLLVLQAVRSAIRQFVRHYRH